MLDKVMCESCFKPCRPYLMIEVGGEEKAICECCMNKQRNAFRAKLAVNSAKVGSPNNLLGAVLRGQGDE